jgi:hypothetical protein
MQGFDQAHKDFLAAIVVLEPRRTVYETASTI